MRRSPIELVAGELRVRGTGLYLDARRKRPCGFVSHAHADHLGRHERTIATRATAALARHRLGDRKGSEVLPADYRAPFGLGELTLELGTPELVLMVRESSMGADDEEMTTLVEQVLPLDLLFALLGDFSFPLPALYGIELDEGGATRDASGVYTGLEISLK